MNEQIKNFYEDNRFELGFDFSNNSEEFLIITEKKVIAFNNKTGVWVNGSVKYKIDINKMTEDEVEEIINKELIK